MCLMGRRSSNDRANRAKHDPHRIAKVVKRQYVIGDRFARAQKLVNPIDARSLLCTTSCLVSGGMPQGRMRRRVLNANLSDVCVPSGNASCIWFGSVLEPPRSISGRGSDESNVGPQLRDALRSLPRTNLPAWIRRRRRLLKGESLTIRQCCARRLFCRARLLLPFRGAQDAQERRFDSRRMPNLTGALPPDRGRRHTPPPPCRRGERIEARRN